MHILIGLAAAVALLWFWLYGSTLARFLVFLVLVPVLGCAVGLLLTPAGTAVFQRRPE